MNEKNAVGVFDSGLGGLTAVKELYSILDSEDIVYFGDTSRVPYGTRGVDTIVRYARQDLNFLSTFNIKAALVACGTISAVALDRIRDDYDFPVVGVIDCSARAAVAATRNGRIGIIGTSATVRSDAYSRALKALAPDCETISVACPLLVPLVENGHIGENDMLINEAVSLYLTKIAEFGADTLILGCTHYPIIAHTIAAFMGDGVTLINSGREAAKEIRALLSEKSLLNPSGGTHRYFVSDSIENFETYGGIFMQRSINGEVCRIDIEKY